MPRLIPARNAPGYALGMGFAAVLALMLFLTAVGLVQLEASQRRLEGIVGNHLAKVTLATRMHTSARERTVGLRGHDPARSVRPRRAVDALPV